MNKQHRVLLACGEFYTKEAFDIMVKTYEELAPVIRYNELKRCIGTISHKTLSSTLKELESDKLILRTEYPQIPPKVEYRLTERGKSLIPVLNMMCEWGGKNKL